MTSVKLNALLFIAIHWYKIAIDMNNLSYYVCYARTNVHKVQYNHEYSFILFIESTRNKIQRKKNCNRTTSRYIYFELIKIIKVEYVSSSHPLLYIEAQLQRVAVREVDKQSIRKVISESQHTARCLDLIEFTFYTFPVN